MHRCFRRPRNNRRHLFHRGLQQVRDIEERYHPAVADDGRPHDITDPGELPAERFHQHLLFAQDLVDHERHALLGRTDHRYLHERAVNRLPCGSHLQFEHIPKPDHGDRPSIDHQRFAVLNRLHLLPPGSRHPLDIGGRQDKQLFRHPDEDASKRRQSERHDQAKGRPLIPPGMNRYRAVELLHLLPDDGQPKSPAGQIGDEGAGRHTRLEHQLQRLPIVEGSYRFRRDLRLFDGGGDNLCNINPSPIVGHRDLDLAIVRRDLDPDGAMGRFVLFLPLRGGFNAMVQTVPHQMDERILELLQNPPVHLDIAAIGRHFRLFPCRADEVAHQSGEHLEH